MNLCCLSKQDFYNLLNNDIICDRINFENSVKEIVKEYDFYSSNALKPSKESCESLEILMQREDITHFLLDDWLQIAKDCLFQKRNTKDEEDLQNRCFMVAKSCIETNTSDVVIFDGHGRTLYYLIKFLMHLAPNKKFNIHIPDIDQYSYKWHKLFFPKSSIYTIKNYFGNFFNLRFPNTSVVYLNFCGIGKSGNALTRYIKRYDCKQV